MLDLHRVLWSFYFPYGQYICAIWRHILSTNSGESYGHKLCSAHSGFVFSFLWEGYYVVTFTREKGRDLTQSYDKSPYTNRNVKRAKWQHKQRHKKNKSKRYDLIHVDTFNDTSRYLDIFTIDNLDFQKHSWYISKRTCCIKQVLHTKKLLSLVKI